MAKINIKKSIVSAEWLNQNFGASNLVVLDTTMNKVTNNNSEQTVFQIPSTRFFNIKSAFSNVSDPFPNAVPSEKQFTLESQKLGLNKDSAIVVYDDKGIYSSARVWWLFKAFGHSNIAVLNGGLPEWLKANYEVESKKSIKFESGNFIANYNPEYFKFFNDIQKSINNESDLILDARSADRFNGLVVEPRAGLRSGNIPNSKNLPFTDLFDGNKLKDKDDLISIFNNFNVAEKNLIFSCGSGMTACILALGADIADCNNLSVYDGSWTEYGSLTKNDSMESNVHWTKDELVAYILLYASQSDLIESNKEKNIIISKVDMKTFQKIHDEFDNDNDYQSIQKIIAGLKAHNYSKIELDLLFADIKTLFFADGDYDTVEHNIYSLLKKIID